MTKRSFAWYGSLIGIIAGCFGIIGGIYAGTNVIGNKIDCKIETVAVRVSDSLDQIRGKMVGRQLKYIELVVTKMASEEEKASADKDYERWIKQMGGK